jgi:DNA adenine methylase
MDRPLLRWVGSKRLQLPIIQRYWPAHFERYVEPFCGSCAALFYRSPQRALMNDINPELINFWRIVKCAPKELYARSYKIANSEETYYKMRAQSPTELSAIDRAVRFLYLNRYSFNGLYRTNRRCEYNVPYGGIRCGDFPPLAAFLAHAKVLASTELHCGDFEECLTSSPMENDFIYLDPPYAVKGTRVSGEYDLRSFRSIDFERLVSLLYDLNRRGIKFLLTYPPDERATSALSHFILGRYPVRRRISGFRYGRTITEEVAFANYQPGA